jgi:uncharacterized protein YjbJ (UPF0337 family)
MERTKNELSKGEEMAEKVDKAKGRTKKAAGEVTGNKSLKRKGEVDKAGGKTKEKVGKAAEKAKKAL